ncbi:hypothetical protein GALL_166800 [mine drainage metagenome]|uniref:Uncharacterized protein n=1 Tax=mine drainage metagenome TaxID=410659 RepID=A0A1J5RYK0_9ZZZZ
MNKHVSGITAGGLIAVALRAHAEHDKRHFEGREHYRGDRKPAPRGACLSAADTPRFATVLPGIQSATVMAAFGTISTTAPHPLSYSESTYATQIQTR